MKNIETTFLNGDKELEEKGRNFLDDIEITMIKYMKDEEIFEKGDDYLPQFGEYGYGLDYVTVEESKDGNLYGGYWRFTLAGGGPGAEIRFYDQDIYFSKDVEFAYLDWFVGVGFDISDLEWAQWLKEVLYMVKDV